ncbi:hypothetical protein N8I71_10935 [Roseibacterium sp. SDUM158016]|uniref:hypothetical protein n=1 Tax=Roseicyclus sediminis TaxID=2980997 RepID=UPI0021CE006D|nr:hypothetical protein [Roseibacterium sp. SDUM158016]MCU4653351.1 hypothetical protein [Roseibacterium sp. SDUM158016]
MRRVFILLGGALVIGAATAGLLWLTTATSARFETDGDRLLVSGQLTLASTERLDRLLEENGDLSTLVLGDIAPGSDATALFQKGGLVRAAGLSTEVAPGVTLEGDAVYLFLAGVERRLGGNSGLAVTDWQTRDGPASALPREHPAHAERLDYVRRMLGNEDFYWFALQAGAGGRHEMTAVEQVVMNVVTSQ